MNFHLTEIASQVAPGARAVVLIDGAGWHEKAKDLRVPDNITLMTLPPYSPESSTRNPPREVRCDLARRSAWPRPLRRRDHCLVRSCGEVRVWSRTGSRSSGVGRVVRVGYALRRRVRSPVDGQCRSCCAPARARARPPWPS
jgi:hypothetical protein